MKYKLNKNNKQQSLDDRISIFANLFIDRIIEEHQKRLKLGCNTPIIRLDTSKQ